MSMDLILRIVEIVLSIIDTVINVLSWRSKREA